MSFIRLHGGACRSAFYFQGYTILGNGRPRDKCGEMGNGDVEVGFTSVEELPYVISIIRQSFELQIGAG
jgi:hypothetical protein